MNLWDKLEKLCDRHLDERLIERLIAEQKQTNELLEEILARTSPPLTAPATSAKIVLGNPVSQ